MESLMLGFLAGGLQPPTFPAFRRRNLLSTFRVHQSKVPVVLKELRVLLPCMACHRTCTTKYQRTPYPTSHVLRAWPRKTKGSSSRTGGINRQANKERKRRNESREKSYKRKKPNQTKKPLYDAQVKRESQALSISASRVVPLPSVFPVSFDHTEEESQKCKQNKGPGTNHRPQ